METVLKAIADWIKGILTAGIMSNLSGLFDDVNTQVGNIAQQVGTKPSSFEPRVFAMIESLSRNVVLPIAGIILTFIACYELIEMITQHNNMAQFEPALIMRWIFKTAISVWLISNTFDIVMAVFDVTQKVVSDSSSIIAGNTRVGEIAVQVGTTPAAWNAGVFSLIRQLSETVILPVAGLVLTFVATYELIQLIIEKNNLHDLDYWIFFKWIFKTAAAILILSNTFNIVMAVFDVSQSVIASAAGIVQGSTDISSSMIDTLEASLETMSLGALLGLWLQSFLIHVTMWALNIVIFVIVYGRMIEIYCMVSLAPIPMATFGNHEQSHMGQNYLKCLFALGFQGFLILICVAIYAVLIQSVAISGDAINSIWSIVGYTVLLCFSLFKTSSVTKSVLGAH